MAQQRILVVDDEPSNVSALRACLKSLGAETVGARGGREALEILARDGADLVLVDLRMPDMSGIDVLTKVREAPRYVPVVLVTGRLDHEDRIRGLEAGADDFFEKPLDFDVLLARVRTLLRLKTTTDDLETRTRELAARNEVLATLQEKQRELAQFIVHDLRNPIATLYANITYLMEVVSAQPEVAEALLDTEGAARRLQSMVDDLLTIARLEESALPLRPSRVDLSLVVDELLRAHAREARDASVSLGFDVPTGLSIHADPLLLRRMLDNLVENAVRHTPNGGRVFVRAARSNPAEIVVANTGAPVAVEDRERIFGKFERGSGAPLGSHVGLGLYFCRLAAEAHGGQIWLDSSAEWPVRFVLRLGASTEGLRDAR